MGSKILLFSLLLFSTAFAATYTVGPGAQDYTTVAAAVTQIDVDNSAGTIQIIGSGTYSETFPDNIDIGDITFTSDQTDPDNFPTITFADGNGYNSWWQNNGGTTIINNVILDDWNSFLLTHSTRYVEVDKAVIQNFNTDIFQINGDRNSSQMTVTNTIFRGNSKVINDHGTYGGGPFGSMYNCTFYNNTAVYTKATSSNKYVAIHNSIFNGNTTDISSSTVYANCTYNLVPSTASGWGTGTVYSDAPAFVGTTNPSDFAITTGSTAKDVGTNSSAPSDDMLGATRPYNTTTDIGAFEFGAATPAAPTTHTWTNGGGDNNWSTATNWSGVVVPGPNDTVMFNGLTSVANCNLDMNDTVGVIISANTYSGTFALSTYKLGVKGSADFSGITVDDQTSELVLVGSGTYTNPNAMYKLTVAGTYTNEDNHTINNTFTVSGTLTLNDIIKVDGGTNFSGGTINGAVAMIVVASTTLSTAGTLNCPVTFRELSSMNLPARDYGGKVLVSTYATSGAMTVTLLSGTHNYNGGIKFTISSTYDNALFVNDSTNDPTVNITGELTYDDNGAVNDIILNMGDGTWTVNNGTIDLTQIGTINRADGRMKLTGTGSFNHNSKLSDLEVTGNYSISGSPVVWDSLIISGTVDL